MLAEAPGVTRAGFAQLGDSARHSAYPVGLVFEREPEAPAPRIELGLADSLLPDIVISLQSFQPVAWRLIPSPKPESPTRRAEKQRQVGT